MRRLLPRVAVVLAASLPGAPRDSRADEPGRAIERHIRVVIAGLRSDLGRVRCALYDDPRAFPRHPSSAVATTRSDVRGGEAVCDFPGPRAGWYAVAAYHDENDNSQFDRNWIGLPVEGHATSNDVRTTVTVPTFDAARFPYFGGVLQLAVHMMY